MREVWYTMYMYTGMLTKQAQQKQNYYSFFVVLFNACTCKCMVYVYISQMICF